MTTVVLLLALAATPVPSPAPAPPKLTEVRLPGADWAVRLDLTGMIKNRDDVRPDNPARIAKFHREDMKLNVTVRIVPLEPGHSLQLSAQERLTELMVKPPTEQGLDDRTRDPRPSFRYWVEYDEPDGKMVLHHVHRFWRHGGTLVEVHASVVGGYDDTPPMDRIMDSVVVPE